MSDAALSPDSSVMQSFLEWWFAECIFGRIEIGWIDRQTKALNRFRLFSLGEPDIGLFAAAINSVEGQSVYFRAVTVNPALVGRTTDRDFVEAPGFWIDQD